MNIEPLEIDGILCKITGLQKITMREVRHVEVSFARALTIYRERIVDCSEQDRMAADLAEAQCALEARQLEQAYCLHTVLSVNANKRPKAYERLLKLVETEVAFKAAMCAFYLKRVLQVDKHQTLALTADFLAALEELDSKLLRYQTRDYGSDSSESLVR